MSRQGETKRVVYRHPLGRYEVTETTGVNIMGDTYHIREAELTPEWDARGLLNDADKIAPPILAIPEDPPQKRTRKVIGKEERKRICAMWRQGFTAREIAIKCDRADSTILGLLNDEGLREPKMRKPWEESDTAEAVRLWNDGWSMTRIAEKMGRKKSTVAHYLRLVAKETGCRG